MVGAILFVMAFDGDNSGRVGDAAIRDGDRHPMLGAEINMAYGPWLKYIIVFANLWPSAPPGRTDGWIQRLLAMGRSGALPAFAKVNKQRPQHGKRIHPGVVLMFILLSGAPGWQACSP